MKQKHLGVNLDIQKLVFEFCSIDNNYLNTKKSHALGYWYNFKDINSIIKNYDINKPIYYVIEKMKFEGKVRFDVMENTHIIFKNCEFNDEISIWSNNGGEIIFENNTYYIKQSNVLCNNPLIKCEVQSLKIINENFQSNNDKTVLFGPTISIKADTLEILNSTFNIKDSKGIINIEAKKTDILSSKIDCPNISIKTEILDVYKSTITSKEGTLDIRTKETHIDFSCFSCPTIALTSKELDISDTSVTAQNGIIIETEKNNKLETIISPLIIHNGTLIKANIDEEISINEESEKRMKLINTLRNIQKITTEINSKKLIQVKNNLETQSISKTLKLNKGMNKNDK